MKLMFTLTTEKYLKQKKRLKVIECSGTDFEIGRQYGEAAKENIIKSIDALMGRVKTFHKTSKEEVLMNTRKYLPEVESFDPNLIETLRGWTSGRWSSSARSCNPTRALSRRQRGCPSTT